MAEFENIRIGPHSVPALTVTAVLMLAIPFVFFICWRRKHKDRTKVKYLIAGALSFLVSARVLELAVHYFCILADNPVSRFINGSTAVFVLYGTVMAGVFEECGRHIVLKYIMKKDRTRENAVLYGIGHGGIEILAVVLPAIVTYLAAAIAFSGSSAEEAMKALKITGDTAAAALPSVQAAAAFDYPAAAMNVVERLIAMLMHIGLTVIVFYGVKTAKKGLLPSAILLHMLADTFAALYQRGAVSLWAVELWSSFWTAAIVFAAVGAYRKMKEQAANAAPAPSDRSQADGV
ncbi:MAG: YhfC family intramembrane metalloprotease [Oscillospiraceae bacterium]|nr:YhfC family intramembrane metalloprotease [Oscillospiraceae bacterium]